MNNDNRTFQFDDWMRWPEHRQHPKIKHSGVYLLGKFDSPPSIVSHLDRDVIYIGETVNQSLAGRLYQFGRSAFQRKFGHSGGWTFSDRFLSGKKQDDVPPWLYVALLPVTLDEPNRSAYIRFAERAAIWDYVQKWGAFPICNVK